MEKVQMSEIEKLCAKRDEMEAELSMLKPRQVEMPGVIKRVIQLSTMLCVCDKMIAEARSNALNKN
jgi:hypothetical protein